MALMSEIKDIVEGFNAGYIIKKSRPELFEELTPELNNIELPYFEAFIKGGVEFTEERIKSLMKKNNLTQPAKDKLTKGKPDIDIEL